MTIWVVITDTDNGVDVAAFYKEEAAEEHERALKDQILDIDRSSERGDVPADAVEADEEDYFAQQGIYFTTMGVEVR